MRDWRVFRTPQISPSDAERSLPTGAGMAGLRQKARHKIRRGLPTRRIDESPPLGKSCNGRYRLAVECRRSIALGRVWWWAQNWAQSLGRAALRRAACALEAAFLLFVTLFLLAAIEKWYQLSLVGVAILLLGAFMRYQWSVCCTGALVQVDAILQDPTRLDRVRSYFAKLSFVEPTV
jgi:hypothetical protein